MAVIGSGMPVESAQFEQGVDLLKLVVQGCLIFEAKLTKQHVLVR